MRIGTALANEGVIFTPTGYSHLLSVVDDRGRKDSDADQPDGGCMLWGIVPREETAGWFALKEAANAAGEAAPCRAQFKLREAMSLPEVSEGLQALLVAQHGAEPEPEPEPSADAVGLVVMDLGAAPGGWTEILCLSSSVRRVLAVDPGELDPKILEHPKVRWMQMRSDEAVTMLTQLERGEGTIGLVVCDMNFDALHAAAVVASTSPLLHAGAVLVLTIKLPFQCAPGLVERRTRACSELLTAAGFAKIRVRHLMANTRWERTLTAAYDCRT
jgi:23S rRNA C2498 (ribose-2'-O)-methylase RlmM